MASQALPAQRDTEVPHEPANDEQTTTALLVGVDRQLRVQRKTDAAIEDVQDRRLLGAIEQDFDFVPACRTTLPTNSENTICAAKSSSGRKWKRSSSAQTSSPTRCAASASAASKSQRRTCSRRNPSIARERPPTKRQCRHATCLLVPTCVRTRSARRRRRPFFVIERGDGARDPAFTVEHVTGVLRDPIGIQDQE